MSQVVAVDIGGTHVRFAVADVEGGRVQRLGPETVMRVAEHASLQLAWEHYARDQGAPLPRAAGIGVACPVGGEVLKVTNNPWVIRPALIPEKLGVDDYTIVNDFGAVAHAVAQAAPGDLLHICGPERPIPDAGVTTVVGPGTGLGVAHILKRAGRYDVIESEGGHIDYAPLDAIEDRVLAHLRQRHLRVSVERVVAGRGLASIYEALALIEGREAHVPDDAGGEAVKALWTRALDGSDALAAAALDRLCLSLGSVAGDLALAVLASAVVLAGGNGLRLAKHLPRSGFAQRFIAKGRFERRMAEVPVKLITHPQPGLLGAAAAFAARSVP